MKKPAQSSRLMVRERRGFSLVELLVVIMIMTILMTMGAMGIKNLSGGKGISTAIANAEAVFAEARATAASRGVPVRVLIDARDINDTSNYLRRIVVAVQDVNPNTGLPLATWSLVSRGYTLPDGVFYSMTLSTRDGVGGTVMQAQNQPLSKVTDVGEYVVYEFNSQGLAVNPGATFVIGSGSRQRGQAPMVTGNAKRDFAGFALWGNGETSSFRDPRQMGDLATIRNF